jgi:copper chaperone CopZ
MFSGVGGMRLTFHPLQPPRWIGPHSRAEKSEPMTEETFTVGHINCSSCERTIGSLLGDVDGVGQVAADHRTNTIAVVYDEQRISRADVVAELTEIGYQPRGA